MKQGNAPELSERDRHIAGLYRAFKREADYPDDVATAILVLTSVMLERRGSAVRAEDASPATMGQ